MLKKTVVSVALASALGLGLATSAQAGVLGQSVLDITNFRFLNPDTSIVNANQFDVFAFNDSSQATANLNNVIASQAVNSNSFGTLDLPQQCVGSPAATCAAFAQNDFSLRLPPSTVNVARADTLLTGSPIINPAGVPTPAHAQLVAEGQLTSIGGFGNIQANLGLTASFSFSLTNDQTVTIALDSLSHLIAAIDLGDSGTARASEQWTIEIRDHTGALVFSWSPNGGAGGITGGIENADACDLQRAVNAQLPGQTSAYDCSGGASATTGLLLASETYTLGLRHAGDVDVTRVLPEPNSLLLFGLGLAGLGFVLRRRVG